MTITTQSNHRSVSSAAFAATASLILGTLTHSAAAEELTATSCCPTKCEIAQSVQFKRDGVWAETSHGRAFYPYTHKAKFHVAKDNKARACMMWDEDVESEASIIPLCIYLPSGSLPLGS